ncbi:TPA: GDP-mannose 4,6-dehydratase [Candidatus Woesearchaeota archaeon]|nr:GDP-mannose 4,6-dehydratase [Candidatus Woesearchaeota archaeon]HII68360.1 GDP-mannose 4,6-dehydratase [Candidatus Woesearchaeota archaeon]
MGQRIFITGVTGFVASHLVELLLKERDIAIYGAKRWRSPMDNIRHIKKGIAFVDCELCDFLSVRRAIEEAKPDIIFHLAAQSFVPAGTMQPLQTFNVNALGTLNLLESVRLANLHPIIHFASSADVYGHPTSEIITEETLPDPLTMYAASKIAGEALIRQYFHTYHIHSVTTRILTHTGPRRNEHFVESSFAKQIAEIEAGIQEPVMRVGNLASIRTFLDIRDAVKAYCLLVKKGEPGEAYNICGEATLSIHELLDTLLSLSTLKVKVKVEVDPKLFRPVDAERPKLDDSKFRNLTGWKPAIAFKDTLKDLLEYWRGEIKKAQ